MLLIIDNFDSFTYNLVDYFKQLKVSCLIFRNDTPLEIIKNLDFDGIVLSPGPDTPEDSGNLNQIIDYYYNKKPILGICLGHQALAVYFGAKLKKGKKPFHGKISKIKLKEDPLFKDIPKTINVVRYHSLVIKDIPNSIKVLSMSIDKEVMIFKHKRYPIHGIQFHPESILTEYGIDLLNNWVCLNRIR